MEMKVKQWLHALWTIAIYGSSIWITIYVASNLVNWFMLTTTRYAP